MAEWLRRSLQSFVLRFESGWRLHFLEILNFEIFLGKKFYSALQGSYNQKRSAQMVESVDTRDLKSLALTSVWVQVPL